MNPYRHSEITRPAPRATWATWLWALVRGVFLRRWYHRHFIICQLNDYGGNFGPRFRSWRWWVTRQSRRFPAIEPDPWDALCERRDELGRKLEEAEKRHEAFSQQEREMFAGSIFKMRTDEAVAAARPARAPPPPVPLPGPGRPTLK